MSRLSLRKKLFLLLSGSRLVMPLVFACVVGVLTGFAVVGFVNLIDFLQEFFFTGGEKALSFLGKYYIVFIPVIGALLVGPIVTFISPEAKGHGVPEVMKAVALRGGRIRPIVVLGKALASAIAIGSGASAGREGPIVQVGSALGSSFGQWFKLSESRIKNLVACGAAAGISGVFNAPIAGVMFSMEVILRDFGARALSTVVVASVSSSIISNIYLGGSPAFVAPVYSLWSPWETVLYVGLGVISAFTAVLFVFVLSKTEDIFEKWKFVDWLKPAVGGLLLGVIGLYFPQVFGTGLHTIEEALHGRMEIILLFALVLMKIIATSVTLGSGSSGGVFAPALFIGAVLGGGFGRLFYEKMPFPVAPPGAYALVGMASVFAGAAHAPVTAILIVFEMTRDYRMILPIMVAVVVSTSISQMISRESIYTIKLKRKGIDIGTFEEAKVFGAIQVRDAMSENFKTVPHDMPSKELFAQMSHDKNKTFFVVNHKEELVGIVKPEEMQEILFEKNIQLLIADDVAIPIAEYCYPDESLGEATRVMTVNEITILPVMDPTQPKKIIGVLKSQNIFRTYANISGKREDLLGRLEQQDVSSKDTSHVQFKVSKDSSIVGKNIKDLGLPQGVVLTSIHRNHHLVVPQGDTVVFAKDKIWAVIKPETEALFKEWLKANKI